jgi:hypothetical protein
MAQSFLCEVWKLLIQLVKKFTVMQLEKSSPSSKKPANGPYPNPPEYAPNLIYSRPLWCNGQRTCHMSFAGSNPAEGDGFLRVLKNL